MDPNVQGKRKKQGRSTGVAWAIALALGGSATTLSCSPAASQAPVVSAEAKTDVAKAQEHGQDGEAAHFTNDDWWPNRLDLRPLKENAPKGDPIDEKFDYAAEFKKLNLAAVKQDIAKTLTTSQDWWPADYGNYGGLMIRLAWHSAGTYRVTDGRGGAASGTIRFAPLNSWPDNVNLDKARRLLWPIKKKYGRSLSWADLMVLTGNVAFETMGFKTFGFGGGRADVYEPTDINWGPETEWLADARFKDGKTLDQPLGATQMGLIYVNPEGPNGKPDPLAAAQHIRMAFGRMSMNDEETVALIAGGHTLGKAHGAAPPKGNVGREPEAASIEEQGLGWKNTHGTGHGADTITSGLEGAWTYTPVKWSHDYFDNLYNYEWELTKSPAGAQQWTPKGDTERKVPDAHDPSKSHKPIMFTTDLALKLDPGYGPISKRFKEHPEEFEAAFAKAWYKLTHRDMGPYVRLLGPEVPAPQIWQDPVPAADGKLIDTGDVSSLKKKILASGLTVPQLVRTAWASASTYRDTDSRGGANGARVRLAPQKDWEVNQPTELAHVLSELEKIQKGFNTGAKKVSLADLIVLGGVAAVEAAADAAGQNITVPFTPGRTDATQELTDVSTFAPLEPKADGFRNYPGKGKERSPAELLVERADNLNLTAPELTVLIGGLRALNANYGESKLGVLTSHPGTLSNEFFVNLLDQNVQWQKAPGDEDVYEGRSGASKDVVWTATSVDLVFGANSQLRAIAEVYASDDAKAKFAREFAAVWNKVMSLDRFDNEPQRAAALAGLSAAR